MKKHWWAGKICKKCGNPIEDLPHPHFHIDGKKIIYSVDTLLNGLERAIKRYEAKFKSKIR